MFLKADSNIIPVLLKPNNGPERSCLVFVTEGAVENTNRSKITGADLALQPRHEDKNEAAG
jgi:hypothetical protein